MLVDEKIVSIDSYLTTFKKKFNSFSQKVPLMIDYKLEGMRLTVSYSPIEGSQSGEAKTLTKDLRVEEPIQPVIYNLKQRLIPDYPRIYVEVAEPNYTPAEREDLISKEGYGVDEAMKMVRPPKYKPLFRLEKVFSDSNSIMIVEDGVGSKKEKRRLSIPLTSFIQDLNANPIEASKTFWEKSKVDDYYSKSYSNRNNNFNDKSYN